MEQMLKCFLDGDSLAIVGKEFINLQESNAIFIELDDEQLKDFKRIAKENGW